MNKKKREGGLLTFFPWKEGGGGLLGRGGSVEMGSLIEDLLYICIYTINVHSSPRLD